MTLPKGGGCGRNGDEQCGHEGVFASRGVVSGLLVPGTFYEVASSYTSTGFGRLNKWNDGMGWNERP